MNGDKFNYFNLVGPNVIMNKPRYREEKREKITYNFVTDPRLRRGRNYGIVYVTSTAFDETDMNQNRANEIFGKTQSDEKSRTKTSKKNMTKNKEILFDEMSRGIPYPDNMESVGVITDEIKEFLPKAITSEKEVQTHDYIDRPQTPLFTPVKNGEDKGTQIEEGDLFDFDEEVEPVVNVLLFKTLEESRMEVLEEEEIKEMKRQQEDFEKIRNRELEVVQKLENRERRRNEEKNRRGDGRNIRLDMAKLYEQKLVSCVFSKKYLKNIKSNALKYLENDFGVLRKPVLNEYHTKLIPFIKDNCEKLLNEENVVLDEIDNLFDNVYVDKMKSSHNKSVNSEHERIKEEKLKKEEEKKKKEEERQRRREEKKRLQHEKELEEIRNKIRSDLFSSGEYVDDVNEIYDINGYNLKNAKAAYTIGGHFGQFILLIALLKKYYQEIFNDITNIVITTDDNKSGDGIKPEKSSTKVLKMEEEKKEENPLLTSEESNEDELLRRIIDLYTLKSHPFFMTYKPEIMEKIKEIDPNINALDEIFKIDNAENYVKIIELLIDNDIDNNEFLPLIVDSIFNSNAIENYIDFYKNIMMRIFKVCFNNTEFDPKEKIKFYEIPADANKVENFSICNIQSSVITLDRPHVDIMKQLQAKKVAKKDKPPRPFFEPFFCEKTLIVPVYNDKLKIIAINENFERIFRQNFLECCFKIEPKFEAIKDVISNDISDHYNIFVEELKKKLEDKYGKEFINIPVEDPASAVVANPEQPPA